MIRVPLLGALVLVAVGLLAAGCRSVSGDPKSVVGALPDADELWIVVRRGPRAPAWSDDALREAGIHGVDAAGERRTLPPAELAIEADVLGRLAVVRVRQSWPPLSRPLESGRVVWPLPPRAIVDDFVLEIGARRLRGVVREREEAERIYEAARRQGLTATLVDEADGLFRQRFGDVPAGVPLALELGVVQDLPWVDGRIELDLALGTCDATRLTLDVRVDAAVEALGIGVEGLRAELETTPHGGRVRFDGPSPGGAARVTCRVPEDRAQEAWLARSDADGVAFCLVAYPPPVAAGSLELDWPGPPPAVLVVHGGAVEGRVGAALPTVVVGRIAAGAGVVDDAPRVRWSPDAPWRAARRVDVADGPHARALPKACARAELEEVQRRGTAGLDPDEVDARLAAFRALALEHGLVTFATALVLVDARSGVPSSE